MFDWGGRDGVNDTAWSYLEEDHIVPYPREGESGGCFSSECVLNKKRVGESCIDVRGSGKEIIGSQDVFLSSSFTSPMESGTGFCTRKSPDHFGMDPVPKFDGSKWSSCSRNLGGSTSLTYVESTDDPGAYTEEQTFSEFGHSDHVHDNNEPTVADSSFSLSMDGKVEFDNNSSMSGNAYENCGDCFLDCDWASISNFDDPDGIFSDSIFWDEEIGKMDGIMPLADSLNATSQPLPSPDTVISDMACENYSYSFQEGESLGKRKHFEEDKMAVNAVSMGEQTSSLSQFSSRNVQCANVEDNKVNGESRLSKSRKVEQSESDSQKVSTMFPDYPNQIRQIECHDFVSQPFPSGIHYQNGPLGDGCNLSNQCRVAENPYFSVSGSSLQSFVAARNEHQLLSTYNGDYQISSKQPYLMHDVGVSPGAAHNLNPQEKIEKLKRRQQMQAMLAIEMQQKQFKEQVNHVQGSQANNFCAEQRMRKTRLVEPKIPVDQENLHDISVSGAGYSLKETAFCQLGNVISKLDNNLKICMRDSLFRLARSATERMGAEDRNSINIDSRYEDKVAPNAVDASNLSLIESTDAEPETNQIDRIVALLLFDKHSQTFNGLVNNGPSRYKAVDNAQM